MVLGKRDSWCHIYPADLVFPEAQGDLAQGVLEALVILNMVGQEDQENLLGQMGT